MGREHLDGLHAGTASAVREMAHRAAFAPILRTCTGPLRVEGEPLFRPAVYVANHASHADTVVLREAVGGDVRRRLAVAAADVYFFGTRRRGLAATVGIGAFPFPRSGALGLRRAEELLSAGWSVVLFPQGTRDPKAEYRPGALRLAEDGWPVVPVGISGTERILPKGAVWPRRHPVAVVFGAPLPPMTTGQDGLACLAATLGRLVERARRQAGS